MKKGQVVYVAPRWRAGDLRECLIASVGRKYITLASGERFDVNGDGINGDSRLFSSREEFETDKVLKLAWAMFVRNVGRQKHPSSVAEMDVVFKAVFGIENVCERIRKGEKL